MTQEEVNLAYFKLSSIEYPAGINNGRGLKFERYVKLKVLKDMKSLIEDIEENKMLKYNNLDVTGHDDCIPFVIESIEEEDEIWVIQISFFTKDSKEEFRKIMNHKYLMFGKNDGPEYEIVEK